MEVVEGHARCRTVLREFPDYASALACYRSLDYQRARLLRLPHSTCDFLIVEGYDGPQPPSPASPPASAARKGYWIGHVDMSDPEAYKLYAASDGPSLGKFGGRFLICGGTQEVVEGNVRGYTAVVEFPSYDAALACYRSPDYRAVKRLFAGAERDLLIVEGYDGPRF